MDDQVYNLKPTDYDRINDVVILHLNYLETNFTKNIYSTRLLNYYYRSLINLQENITYFYIVDDTVAGYICFIKSLRNIYLKIIKNYNVLFIINYMAYMSTQPKKVYQDILNRLLTLRKNFRQRKSIEHHDSNTNKKEIYELRPIVVAPMHRGSGLAHLLIERAEEDLLNKGESKYFLRVNRMNQRAINFYTKVGLRIVGTEGPDALRMEKVLL